MATIVKIAFKVKDEDYHKYQTRIDEFLNQDFITDPIVIEKQEDDEKDITE
jgi:hypothetical protein